MSLGLNSIIMRTRALRLIESRLILLNRFTMDEHSAPGTVITTLTVLNGSDGGNGYTFTLDDNDGGRFAIDTLGRLIAGLVTTEFDDGATRTITLRASKSLETDITREVDINVLEIISAPPQILVTPRTGFAPGVTESTPAFSTLYDLDVTELDDFTFTSGADPDNKFAVVARTIVLTEELDFSAQSTHSFTINVIDNVTGSVFSKTISVTVLPAAATTLAATWAAGFERQVLFEDLSLPHSLATLAVSPDVDGYTFSLQSNSVGNLFDVSGNTLRLIAAPNYNVARDLTIVVSATNGVSTVILVVELVVAPGAPQGIRYITNDALSTGRGSSPADPAPLAALNSMIAGTLAGGTVRVKSDGGMYPRTSEIRITTGGTVGNPILVAGYDGSDNPGVYEVTGDRTPWTLPSDPEEITDVGLPFNPGTFNYLRLGANASNLTFRDTLCRNLFTGCRIRDPNSNLIFDNFGSYNVGRMIEDDLGTVNGLTIRNFTSIGNSRECIRIQADTHNVLIEDFHINGGRQTGANFAAGIAFLGTAHDIIVRSNDPDVPFIIENQHDQQEKSGGVGYWNGDGISSEGSNYNIHIQDGIVRGCTDGGLDNKCANLTVLRVLSDDNKRNFRGWGTTSNPAISDQTYTDCISRNPHTRGGTTGLSPTHVWTSNGVDAMFVNLLMEDSDASAIAFNSESPLDILRFKDALGGGVPYVYDGLGTLKVIDASAKQYDPVDNTDVTPPTYTLGLSYSIDEGASFSQQLSASEGNVTYKVISGDTPVTCTRDGLMAMSPRDFEGPNDANHDNVYDRAIRVRDGNRNETTSTFHVTVNDVPGDTGGDVALGSVFGWRWNIWDRGANTALSGSENKIIAKTVSAATATTRASTPFFPPLHHKVYWEKVIGTIGTPASYAVGLANRSATLTDPLGFNNHSLGYYADGAVKIGGVTVATLDTYVATDVIGFAVDVSLLDISAIKADPTKVHDWKKRLLWIYKNGALVSDSGGINIFAIVNALHPACTLHDIGDSVTVRSVASEWTHTPRSGHIAWGSVQQRIVTGSSARYVSPTGTGVGLSWADPAPLGNINSLIAAAKAGGVVNPHVFLRADVGGYAASSTITIANGGSEGNPVTIIGVTVDLIPHPVQLVGNRRIWVLPSDYATATGGSDGWTTGQILFQLSSGCDHLVFSHIFSTRHSSIFNISRTFEDVTIEDVSFYNNRRGLISSSSALNNDGSENTLGYAGTSASRLLMQRIEGTGHSKAAFDVRSKSHDCTIQDFHFDSGYQWGDEWPTGIKFIEASYDSIVRRGWVFRMTDQPATYTQGDGMESNNGNHDLLLEDFLSAFAGDGGVDNKADGMITRRTLVYQPRRGFRQWGDGMLNEDCVSYPTARPIYIRGQDGAKNESEHHGHYAIGSACRLMIEGNHAAIRYFDSCKWVQDDGTVHAFSELPQDFDTATNSRHLFGGEADVTPAVITMLSSKSIVQGNSVSIALTANKPGTWQIKNGSYSHIHNLGISFDTFYQIQNYHNQNCTLTSLAPVLFDPIVPANNTKVVVVQFRDASNNITEHTFTATILEHYVFADSDAQAFSNRVGTLSETQKEDVDNKFVALKAASLYADIVDMQDYRYSLFGWKGVYDATLVGTPTLSSTLGVTTNGIDNAIDTHIPGTAMPQNSCGFAWHDRGSPISASHRVGNYDGTDGTMLNPKTSTSLIQMYINQALPTTSGTPGGSGMVFMNRSGASATQFYRQGAVLASSGLSSPNRPSVAPNVGTIKVGQRGDGFYGVAIGSLVAAIGTSWDATKVAQFNTIMSP